MLPKKFDNWSLTSLQQQPVKTGGGLVKQARYPHLDGTLTLCMFDRRSQGSSGRLGSCTGRPMRVVAGEALVLFERVEDDPDSLRETVPMRRVGQ